MKTKRRYNRRRRRRRTRRHRRRRTRRRRTRRRRGAGNGMTPGEVSLITWKPFQKIANAVIVEWSKNNFYPVAKLTDAQIQNTKDIISIEISSLLEEHEHEINAKNITNKAELFADAAKVELGSVIRISESSNFVSPMPRMSLEMASPSSSSVTPISPGQQDISIQVSVTFEIR